MRFMSQGRSLRGWPWAVENKRTGGQCEAWMEALKQNFTFKIEMGLNQRSKHFYKFEGLVLGLERTLEALLI